MENPFGQKMAAKSDSALQEVVQDKHKYEPEAYIAAIEELERRQLATPELLQEKNDLLESLKQAEPGARRSWKDSLGFLKISKDYVYTPILIYANVLVWLAMVVMGVHPMEPAAQSLADWGGNLPSLTLNGQLWRLFTSMFLHGGLIHLLLNMFALLQVGAVLETQFGKHRYAIVYLAAGILASMASVAFNDNIVSVGASGAIFGLYGLLLSMLLTKSLQMSHAERDNLLYSTLTFVGYNVAFGFAKAGIDNAAHIGGLLSGFALGFVYYPFIGQPRKAAIVSACLAAGVLLLAYVAPGIITNKYSQYLSVMENFGAKESQAMWMYEEDYFPAPGTPEAAPYRERLQKEGIDLWQQNLTQLNTLTDMPAELQANVDLLKEYCQLRIEACEAMQRLTEEITVEQNNRLTEVGMKIDELIAKLEAMNK